jgi:dephospho-CoA kinase
VEPGKPAHTKIRKEFGDTVFLENGELNREELGKLIFDSVEKRTILNSITHPLIHGEIRKQVIKYFFLGHNFVAIELPLLFEIGIMINYIHKIICVCW